MIGKKKIVDIFCRNIPYGVFFMTMAFQIVFSSTLDMRMFSSGILVTPLLNIGMKEIFKNIYQGPNHFLLEKTIGTGDRPSPHRLSSYGMPSGHSQFAGYCVGFVCRRCSDSYISVTVTGLGVLLSFSKVFFKYHTVCQTVVGFLVGLFSGIFWGEIVSEKSID